MRLWKWFALIGVVVLVGFAKVAQQTAIWLKAYELGRDMRTLQVLENDTRWLHAKVIALQSPAHLVTAMHDTRVGLVAWSELPATPRMIQVAQVPDGVVLERRVDSAASR